MRTAILIAMKITGGVAAMGGEKKVEVKTYIVRYYCDKDGCDGELVPDGICLTSSPPQYPHTCNKCGDGKTFHKSYPYKVHETVEQGGEVAR